MRNMSVTGYPSEIAQFVELSSKNGKVSGSWLWQHFRMLLYIIQPSQSHILGKEILLRNIWNRSCQAFRFFTKTKFHIYTGFFKKLEHSFIDSRD